MNQTMTIREQVSALADGHLQGEEFARAIEAVCADDEAHRVWRAYHLVGDVLRAGAHSPCSDSSAFLARFQQRLAAEPVVSAPAVSPPEAPTMHAVRHKTDAANEPVFRWKLVAGAASLVAVAAISWTLVGNGAPFPSQQAANAVLAAAAPANPLPAAAPLASTRVVVGSGSPQVMLRDPRLDQLLEAHQQAGGASQMPSGFLRNATFEGPTR
jgi:sigma-E factor negative regulatory protein RseA